MYSHVIKLNIFLFLYTGLHRDKNGKAIDIICPNQSMIALRLVWNTVTPSKQSDGKTQILPEMKSFMSE